MDTLVIGLDYGTDSVRALLARAADGQEVACAVSYFPRWSQGKFCTPEADCYRQHPLDYLEAAEDVIKKLLSAAPPTARDHVVGIAFDTTGSTPCFVDETCKPLAMHEKFSANPNAMFILWKDHTAVEEAARINALAQASEVNYTTFSGGTYSSEWFWSKALHVIKEDPAVAEAAYTVVECAEWLPAHFAGVEHADALIRSRCACGHKAMWNEQWGGFPPKAFFEKLHPTLGAIRGRMGSKTQTADQPIGHLSPNWAKRLGLSVRVVVAGGAIDAHVGAIGAGIKARTFVRVMGTSTCDMMVIDPTEIERRCIAGICGQVDGSILPGMIGLEAGQSAYGDVFAWYARLLHAPVIDVMKQSTLLSEDTKKSLEKEIRHKLLDSLSDRAKVRGIQAERGPYAVDWFNGRRTPDANQRLRGAIHGLTIGTDAAAVYRALLEATAFGSKAIVERFQEEGVAIESVVAVGGVTKKSPLAMQILADVLNMTVMVCESTQVCALGAAIVAAAAAGCFPSIIAAQQAMSSKYSEEYKPIEENVAVYQGLYARYKQLAHLTQKLYARM